MKFVLAPDSFKESMTSKEVCNAMTEGIRKVFSNAEIIAVPMADGGEGTMQSMIDSTNGTIYSEIVKGPLGRDIKAQFGILGDKNTAIVEAAEACGLQLVDKSLRNPLITTTYGVGQLIKSALDMNINKLIITLGGSSTNDGGVGMLQALGVKFLDEKDEEISFGGAFLSKIRKIDISMIDKRIKNIEIKAACDVKNHLTGDKGASRVFAKQKGASEEDIVMLDNNLKHYANVVKEQYGIDIDNVEGAGAAGGLGAAVTGFLGGKLENGFSIVSQCCNLESKMKNADFVITGEGSIDSQTKEGKTPYGVAKTAKKFDIPVIALCGRLGEGIEELYEEIDSIVCTVPGAVALEDALKNGKINITRTMENICRIIKISKNL